MEKDCNSPGAVVEYTIHSNKEGSGEENMGEKKEVRLYNLMFPLWMLVFYPSWLWLVLIPANYLLDRLVLRWSLRPRADRGLFCRRHTWKICLAGFFGDLVGAVLLVGVFLAGAWVSEGSALAPMLDDLVVGVGFNPFSSPAAFGIVALAVLISGLVLFLLDRAILRRAGLDPAQAKKSALALAVITAPYLFFFPSALLYENGIFTI